MAIATDLKEMIRPWLTGELAADAQKMRRKFKMLRLSIQDWRDIISQVVTQ